MASHSFEQPGRAKIDDQGSGKWNWWSLLPAPVQIILHRPCCCDPEVLGQNRFPRRLDRPWELSAQTVTRGRSAALIFQRDRRHIAMNDERRCVNFGVSWGRTCVITNQREAVLSDQCCSWLNCALTTECLLLSLHVDTNTFYACYRVLRRTWSHPNMRRERSCGLFKSLKRIWNSVCVYRLSKLLCVWSFKANPCSPPEVLHYYSGGTSPTFIESHYKFAVHIQKGQKNTKKSFFCARHRLYSSLYENEANQNLHLD